MLRVLLITVLCLWIGASSEYSNKNSNDVIAKVDTEEDFLLVRRGKVGRFASHSIVIPGRPKLGTLRAVCGDLTFIFAEIHGVENPRISVESHNPSFYQVVYQMRNPNTIELLAKCLHLCVQKEKREILAISIRLAPKGHLLRPTTRKEKTDLSRITSDDEGRWPLENVSCDELATFLETKFRRPVVDLTALKGRWSVLLSRAATKNLPTLKSKVEIDNLGLVLGWEYVKMELTVIKDKLNTR